MVSSNEYINPAAITPGGDSALTVNQDYLADKNKQAFDFYKFSQAITAEIIATLAEAGIAPEQELQALLAAAGIGFSTCQPETALKQLMACHHCTDKA
ncbi:hypothetical protein [Thalassomonas haliotis]|uniref:Uncharacterized protein n=1 Tax=Thalassomonas haliotis TaxID=485448 RepID=A0ABY7VEH9_9GAMM|nr:hypothetical protein [Thalassomonas haliotis]WDE11303.1 hypothetical protein H3N35_24285 [Thalassomonas haliotis]